MKITLTQWPENRLAKWFDEGDKNSSSPMPGQLLLRETEGPLANEHSLLDDNGQGTRVEALDESGDGYLAGVTWLRRTQVLAGNPTLASERTGLETQIAALKSRKSQMGSDTYYAELETLFVALARLNDQIEGEL